MDRCDLHLSCFEEEINVRQEALHAEGHKDIIMCFPLETISLMLELEDEFMLPKHFPKEAMC